MFSRKKTRRKPGWHARQSFGQCRGAPTDCYAYGVTFFRLRNACCTLLLLGVPSALSQTPPPAVPLPDAPSPSTQPQPQTESQETPEQRKARERAEAEREVKAEEKQRIGGVIPNFNVVLSGTAVPLTPKEKFDLAFHSVIDPYTIGLAVIVGGGFGELDDDHTGYNHGPAGFFKRVGASYADNADGTMIGNAVLPVLLKQDPRYFRKGTGTIKSRIVYSALTAFICRSDSGHRQFNTSNVLGNFISGAISNAYYPASERGVSLTISNASTVTLEGMIGAQLLEFSPDVTDKLKRHRQAKRDAKAAAQGAAQAGEAHPSTP